MPEEHKTRSRSGGSHHAPPKQKATTTFVLTNAYATVKKHLKNSGMLRGIWTTDHTYDSLTHAYSINRQTQMTITDNTITLYKQSTNYEAIKAIVKHTNPRENTPNKKPNKGTKYPARRTTPGRSQGEGDAERDLAFVESEVHHGILTVQNHNWRHNVKIFTDIMENMYGVTPVVTNNFTHSAMLARGTVRGKPRQVTLNYYPTSGKFTLTGPSHLQTPFYDFFHKMVKDGPEHQHTHPQMDDESQVYEEEVLDSTQHEEEVETENDSTKDTDGDHGG
jgi:hypothetical protein